MPNVKDLFHVVTILYSWDWVMVGKEVVFLVSRMLAEACFSCVYSRNIGDTTSILGEKKKSHGPPGELF
jgi:hypothetical protein